MAIVDDLTPDSFTFTASAEGDTAAVTFGQPYEASTTIAGTYTDVAGIVSPC